MTASDLKEKYKDKWVLSNIREDIVRKWLSLILKLDENEIELNGIGVLSDKEVPETWEGDPRRKYDFYIPKFRMYIDVTGTEFTKRESYQRAKEELGLNGSVIAVLGVKYAVGLVLEEKYNNRAVIASVNDEEGEIRFIPIRFLSLLLKKGKARSTKEFAKGENEYVLIPWKYWWKPKKFQDWLSIFI
ncbi:MULTISPECIES: nuclease [Metallosphaera]|uniref:nuclease n=2 Tax=cellular organisms TaxID=131567 RepID=UPI002989ADA3|nr:nuclease [Metallosphaera sedula]MCP6729970.1 nuclease [Metallosphaera sedula]